MQAQKCKSQSSTVNMPYLRATSNFQSFSNCKLSAAQVPHVHTQGQAQIGLLKKKARNAAGQLRDLIL